MKILGIDFIKPNTPQYKSIYADDERILIIDDERGGRVELRGAEIGELFAALKPPLMG